MQINAVRLNDTNFTSMSQEERAALTRFANADDKALRNLAYRQASIDVNDKKHKRITNGIIWSIPVVAGLAAMATGHGKLPVKPNRQRSALLLLGAGEMLRWIGSFAIIDTVFGIRDKIAKHVAPIRKINEEHPLLSFAATAAASFGALVLAGKGLTKFAAKPVKTNRQAMEVIVKANNIINNSAVLNKASELVQKVPSAIRAFGKDVLSFGPLGLVVASVVHSSRHSSAKQAQAFENYKDLKVAQYEARRNLVQDSLENVEERDELEENIISEDDI